MSAPSTRRLKDRNGVAGPNTFTAMKPSKTLTPISYSHQNPRSATKKSVSGKENPRLNPRTQKPVIKPVPRVDKSAVAVSSRCDDSEVRVRRSISSMPRGRSPSPSDFIRVLRDSRVSKGENDKRLVSSAGKKIGNRVFRDCKKNDSFGVGLEKKSELCEGIELKVEEIENELGGFGGLNGSCNKEVNLCPNLIKPSKVDAVCIPELELKVPNGGNFHKIGAEKSGCDFISHCTKESSEKSHAVVLDNSKVKRSIEEGTDSRVSVKYQSKLHEKLAFLEGKVKKIASDIKRTKEMLDANNPDASKVILSDIQEKISGIEKAMGNVSGDSAKRRRDDGDGNKVVEKIESEEMNDAKASIKLNNEELEERLFPHHKLLRNRTSLKTLLTSQSHDGSNVKSNNGLNVEEKVLSPIEENPIAREFLFSLNKENTNVTARDAMMGMESCEVQETNDNATSNKEDSSTMFFRKPNEELMLTTDETLDEFDDQENRPSIIIGQEIEEIPVFQENDIGTKTATGGWFVSEGESVLLAHDDGSCSFYDVTNCEEKAVYKPPTGVSLNMWRDCWIIRAPSADGCSGKYVVAASAGNTLGSGFCSWDFYTKDVRAFHFQDEDITPARTILGPLSNYTMRERTFSSSSLAETRHWWYRPCGPLITSAASCQRVVKIFDIRDGEEVLKWEVQKPVLAMDYSSPLQWRNRGKVVVVEAEAISVWDVNSLHPQSLLSVPLCGRKISALHVINTDAELGGGVRQRVTTAEADGNDGVFCTPDSINVLDFRHPSGIGLKIPKIGVSVQSVFTRGDSIYVGCACLRSAGKKQASSQVQHFSLRKQKLVSSYSLPESNAHSHHSAVTQVWGNSNLVMGVCAMGLHVFDALNDDERHCPAVDYGSTQMVKNVVGPDDLYSPSFDYLASRVLLISRDRPALWRYLP